MRCLIAVQDTFQIAGRGFVVVPGPLREEVAGTGSLPVELRKPSGERVRARLSLPLKVWLDAGDRVAVAAKAVGRVRGPVNCGSQRL